MGQRHQAFIIARILAHGNPKNRPQYRCIGALHHQWCYGRLPLKAAARFMTLIKQEENASIIREELREINGLYGIFEGIPEIPDVPCPFTQFLLSSAWSSELSDAKGPYKSSIISLEASMGSTEGDNNDGITVIDVTDSKNPSYCFFASAYHDPGASPLTAAEYVRGYYSEPTTDTDDETGQEASVLDAVRPFEGVPLITIQKLAEAWPGEYKAAAPAQEVTNKDEQRQELPTLTDLALVPALEQALLSGDINILEIIMATPDRTSKIKEILRSQQSLIPDSGLPLVLKLLERDLHGQHKKSADISQLPLSGQQILEIVTQHADLETLNISHNNRVTIDVVENLLVALPKLRRLSVLNTGITEEDAIAFLERRPDLFRHLEGFIHPAFFKEPSDAQFKGAYMHISDSIYNFGSYAASLPFFTTGQIVQGLTDYLQPLAFKEEKPAMMLSYVTMDTQFMYPVMAAYASHVRQPGQSWGERIVPFVPGALPPSQSLVRKGRQWVFVLLPSFTSNRLGPSLQYAFARANGEVWDDYQRTLEQITEEKNSTPQEKEAKRSAIREGLGSRLFTVFDVRQFFKELELEGRDAPSPDALSKLFYLFSKLDSKEDSNSPQSMEPDAILELYITVETCLI